MSSLQEILKSHSVGTLRNEIYNANIHHYSNMTKARLIEKMLEYPERFTHMKMAEKVRKSRTPRKRAPVVSGLQVLGVKKPRKPRKSKASASAPAKEIKELITVVEKIKRKYNKTGKYAKKK